MEAPLIDVGLAFLMVVCFGLCILSALLQRVFVSIGRLNILLAENRSLDFGPFASKQRRILLPKHLW